MLISTCELPSHSYEQMGGTHELKYWEYYSTMLPLITCHLDNGQGPFENKATMIVKTCANPINLDINNAKLFIWSCLSLNHINFQEN
jgi:hypothetical protein